MSSTAPSEYDPLLATKSRDNVLNSKGKKELGPLEISRRNRYAILAGVWAASFLSSLNTTLVPTMLPSISSDFNKSNQASWLGTSYLLATCTFTPLYGRLCNVMGRRGANQMAIIFTALGCLACGLSNSMEMLIAARFFAGIGGGGIFTISSIVISDMYSMRSRGLTQGVGSVFNGLGMGLGGPLGGLVSDWLGWRWAFLLQLPLYAISFGLISFNMRYVTPGKGKSTIEVLKRIDYAGSLTLLGAVGSILVFLSTRYNEGLPWGNYAVIAPLVLSIVFFAAFIAVEFFVAPEPVLAPSILKQKIPILVGCSNFLVAICNFSITYFFPMWFQTVMLTSASTAGLHLLPNSLSMSTGSVFAGWMMHRSGKYKTINLIFGSFPFIATLMLTMMNENSGPLQSWFSIIPLGFGNAVVLQTMLIALLAHLPESQMAVGTGFGQVFRGIGQVGGVAISSAIFQATLDSELRERIHTPDAEDMIKKIRQSARLVGTLPPDLQRIARDSYASSLKSVFIFASCATFLAYLVRLPIPDKNLEDRGRPQKKPSARPAEGGVPSPSPATETPVNSDDEDEQVSRPKLGRHPRRLSTFESTDGIMDLERDHVRGNAKK